MSCKPSSGVRGREGVTSGNCLQLQSRRGRRFTGALAWRGTTCADGQLQQQRQRQLYGHGDACRPARGGVQSNYWR